jgi:hypothetical protein
MQGILRNRPLFCEIRLESNCNLSGLRVNSLRTAQGIISHAQGIFPAFRPEQGILRKTDPPRPDASDRLKDFPLDERKHSTSVLCGDAGRSVSLLRTCCRGCAAAAVFIGASSLRPGNNGLSIMGVPTYWQYIVHGVLLILPLLSAGLLTMRRR